MDPLRLQKQLRDNSNDLQEFYKEIQQWGDEMKRKEESLKNKDETEPQVTVPKEKQKSVKKPKCDEEEYDDATKTSKIPKDYTYWDKFDVDAECEKIDKEKGDQDSDSELTDEVDESLIDLAMEEKEKGNKFVKAGRYEDAIKSYTKAIEAYSYDPVYYANRALCHLKLKLYKNAETDCTTALQLDGEYVKALHRRALAREALEQYKEAKSDLEKILEIDPKNKESQNLLQKVSNKVNENISFENTPTQLPVSKFSLSRQKVKEKEMSVAQKPIESNESMRAIQDIVERINPNEVSKSAVKLNTNKTKAETITKPTAGGNQNIIYWPSGDNVFTVPAINKRIKDRSKKRLKRLQIFDVEIKSEIFKVPTSPVRETKSPQSKLDQVATKSVKQRIILNDLEIESKQKSVKDVDARFDNIDCNVDTSSEDFTKLNLPVPTTAVQFNLQWKNLKDKELSYLYLRQINPTLYSSIFKDSLETSIFSGIIEVLATEFIDRNIYVFEYLYGLTKVKRFNMLVMIKSIKDKEGFLKLIDVMRTDPRHTKEEVDYLIGKYDM